MKFGILCNGNTLQHWQLETISNLVSGGHTLTLMIVNANPVQEQNFYDKLIHYPYSKVLYRVWFRFLMKPEAKRPGNISDVCFNPVKISCLTTKKGYAEYFDEKDVERIKSFNLDFILRFGFGIIKGKILDSAKYGVWSYHHDDDRKYRGVPTGFWEIMFGDPVNAAVLQRLTNTLDSGVILHKGYFGTINHSWQANLNKLLQSTTGWPLQVCRKIENGDTEFLSVANTPGSAIYKLPGNLLMLRFLFRLLCNKLRFQYRDLFLTEKWNVGIIPLPVEKILVEGESEIQEPVWLNFSEGKSVYHADSFGFIKDNRFHILCEEYDYKKAKGVLTSLQVDRDSYTILNKTSALEKEYHLAYPFLFVHDDIFYCIPENSVGGKIDLYRYETSDGILVFEQALIENLEAVDPTLFYHEGLWWLFFTDKISTNERLHVWYSQNLKGPYVSHANNPVKEDIRSSRPAGNLFMLNGKLLRPAQDCSMRSGRRIVINEVLKLTPTEFVEKEFAVLSPAAAWKYPDGMHTFCVTKEAVIVDGKRELFIRQAFMRKLLTKTKKFFWNH